MDICQLCEYFSISTHHCTELKKGNQRLIMPSTKVTDAKNLSNSIIDIITKFNLEKKIVGFTCDSRANLKKCSDIICYELDHKDVFNPKKPLLAMD